jgi:hypothetical protein
VSLNRLIRVALILVAFHDASEAPHRPSNFVAFQAPFHGLEPVVRGLESPPQFARVRPSVPQESRKRPSSYRSAPAISLSIMPSLLAGDSSANLAAAAVSKQIAAPRDSKAGSG